MPKKVVKNLHLLTFFHLRTRHGVNMKKKYIYSFEHTLILFIIYQVKSFIKPNDHCPIRIAVTELLCKAFVCFVSHIMIG